MKIAKLLADNPACELGPGGIGLEREAGTVGITAPGEPLCRSHRCDECDEGLDFSGYSSRGITILEYHLLSIDLRDSGDPESVEIEKRQLCGECAFYWEAEINELAGKEKAKSLVQQLADIARSLRDLDTSDTSYHLQEDVARLVIQAETAVEAAEVVG